MPRPAAAPRHLSLFQMLFTDPDVKNRLSILTGFSGAISCHIGRFPFVMALTDRERISEFDLEVL